MTVIVASAGVQDSGTRRKSITDCPPHGGRIDGLQGIGCILRYSAVLTPMVSPCEPSQVTLLIRMFEAGYLVPHGHAPASVAFKS